VLSQLVHVNEHSHSQHTSYPPPLSSHSLMHYYMPKKGVLSLHSGCNMGRNGDVSLFFGLSGEQRTGYCVGSIAISLKPVG
jgi:hypothetical protein